MTIHSIFLISFAIQSLPFPFSASLCNAVSILFPSSLFLPHLFSHHFRVRSVLGSDLPFNSLHFPAPPFRFNSLHLSSPPVPFASMHCTSSLLTALSVYSLHLMSLLPQLSAPPSLSSSPQSMPFISDTCHFISSHFRCVTVPFLSVSRLCHITALLFHFIILRLSQSPLFSAMPYHRFTLPWPFPSTPCTSISSLPFSILRFSQSAICHSNLSHCRASPFPLDTVRCISVSSAMPVLSPPFHGSSSYHLASPLFHGSSLRLSAFPIPLLAPLFPLDTIQCVSVPVRIVAINSMPLRLDAIYSLSSRRSSIPCLFYASPCLPSPSQGSHCFSKSMRSAQYSSVSDGAIYAFPFPLHAIPFRFSSSPTALFHLPNKHIFKSSLSRIAPLSHSSEHPIVKPFHDIIGQFDCRR